MLLERLVALVPSLLVLGAALSLLTSAFRTERWAGARTQEDRTAAELVRVIMRVLDHRAPGASVLAEANGVGVRVVRADGAACVSDGSSVLIMRRGQMVRIPAAGDSLQFADTAGADGWRTVQITGANTAATCPDGAQAWRLTLSVPVSLAVGTELLVVEWLDMGLSGGATSSLSLRPRGTATARQPAVGTFPGTGTSLTVEDAGRVQLLTGTGGHAAAVVLRVPPTRAGASAQEYRRAVDTDAAW